MRPGRGSPRTPFVASSPTAAMRSRAVLLGGIYSARTPCPALPPVRLLLLAALAFTVSGPQHRRINLLPTLRSLSSASQPQPPLCKTLTRPTGVPLGLGGRTATTDGHLETQLRAKLTADATVEKLPKRLSDLQSFLPVRGQRYELTAAVPLCRRFCRAAFPETLEAHVNLAVGGGRRASVASVRGVVAFPHAIKAKPPRVVVLAAREDKQQEAKLAGAAVVGGVELLEKIKAKDVCFDVLIATPDMMVELAKHAGKVVGRN
eukprot:GHVT01033285.1.p1 GENE.GHVT01033285.1~~GHVT01033285.1.p1  ORF type:complete len:262 (-),score=70.41 GHVT01033285.1:1878-2663(-)